MRFDFTFVLMLVVIGGAVIAVLAGVLVLLLRRGGAKAPTTLTASLVAERVRAVGKLVGLEVHAKEIATSTKGWGWVPPLLLSQAKIAMIFSFEKQYAVDLSRLTSEDVERLAEGRYRLTLPGVEGALRLTDVSPYDIQAGRILGLLDVIQMNAQTQGELMSAAREQAASLFGRAESRYVTEARRSIGAQLSSLLSMFDLDVEVVWRGEPVDDVATPADLVIEPAVGRTLGG